MLDVELGEQGGAQNNSGSAGGSNSGSTGSKKPGVASKPSAIVGNVDTVKNLKGRTIKIGKTDWQGEKSYQTEMGKYLKKLETSIENKLNCKIEFVNITDFNVEIAAISAGNPRFDIMEGNGPHWIPSFIKGNIFQPLDGIGITFSDSKYDQNVIKAMTFNNSHYALQRAAQGEDKISTAMVTLYNKSLLKRSGVTEDLYQLQEKGQWTWDKMLEIAKKVTKNGNYGIANNQYMLYNGLVYSNGADWISESNGNFSFTAGSPNAMKALEFYQKLSTDYKVVKYVKTGAQQTDHKDFRNGKIGFVFDHVNRIWNTSYYKGMSDDFGVLYLPKGPNMKDYVAPDPYMFYWGITTGSKKPIEIAAVLNEFMEPLIPVKEEKVAFRLQCESATRDEQSYKLLSTLNNKRVLKKSWYVGSFLQWGVWYAELDKVLDGKLTPANAVSTNQKKYDNLIKDNFNFAKK